MRLFAVKRASVNELGEVIYFHGPHVAAPYWDAAQAYCDFQNEGYEVFGEVDSEVDEITDETKNFKNNN